MNAIVCTVSTGSNGSLPSNPCSLVQFISRKFHTKFYYIRSFSNIKSFVNFFNMEEFQI